MVCFKGKKFCIFLFKHPKTTPAGQNPVLLLYSRAADAGIAMPYETSDGELCT